MLEGETTPWYPTMRLFRQTQPGDWSGVIERVTEALSKEAWTKPETQNPTLDPQPSTLGRSSYELL